MVDLEYMRREGKAASSLACGKLCVDGAAEIDELRKIRDGCEKIMLGRKAEIERLLAENTRMREALLVNGLRWSAGTKDEITAEIDRIARGTNVDGQVGKDGTDGNHKYRRQPEAEVPFPENQRHR
jgi:hypothetical protein